MIKDLINNYNLVFTGFNLSYFTDYYLWRIKINYVSFNINSWDIWKLIILRKISNQKMEDLIQLQIKDESEFYRRERSIAIGGQGQIYVATDMKDPQRK